MTGPEVGPTDPTKGSVLRSLPRRTPVKRLVPDGSVGTSRALTMPAPRSMAVARRLLDWSIVYARLWLFDRGSDGPAHVRSVLAAVTALGPASVHVARQFTFRIDLLPRTAASLHLLPNRAPACELNEIIARLEADLGPMDDVFEAFDPVPIATTCVDGKYQAILKGGDLVVVRVRRPGVRDALATELSAVDTLLSALQRLTLIRPGFLEHVRSELAALTEQSLDSRVQARYQSLLRRKLRKDRWGSRVTTARVYPGLQTDRVMVTEFIPGQIGRAHV